MALLLRLGLIVAYGCGFFALFIAFVRFPVPFLLVLGLLWWREQRQRRVSDAYGSARTSEVSELVARGMIGGEGGLVLGRVGYAGRPTRKEGFNALTSPRYDNALACELFLSAFLKGADYYSDRFIRIHDYVHLSTFSPAGGGKTVSVLAPNLFAYRGSCVVVDVKDGELFKLTAQHRQRVLGQKVYKLDPFHVCGAWSDRYNPMDFLFDDMPDLLELCRDVANQIVVRTGYEHERNWDDNAENIIAIFIFFVCMGFDLDERNFDTVRNLLSDRKLYTWVLAKLQNDADSPLTRRLGNLAGWLQDRELNSVMANVHRHTQWMDGELVAPILKKSTFDPLELRSSEQGVTVYLVLPSSMITVMQSWLRLVLGSMLRLLTRNGGDEHRKILFLIDEAGHIGQMRALETAITLNRGAGIRLWFFWQSIEQLKECYKERAGIVLANMATQQYFGIRDYHTADELSKRIGDQTISVVSHNRSTSRSRPTGYVGNGQGGSFSDSTSVNYSEASRRLIKPEEILTLPDSVGLVFHKNLPVMTTRLIRYYRDREYRRGGTGRQAGLSFRTGVMATVSIAGTALLLMMVIALPEPRPTPMIVPAASYRPTPFDAPSEAPMGGLIRSPSPGYGLYPNPTFSRAYPPSLFGARSAAPIGGQINPPVSSPSTSNPYPGFAAPHGGGGYRPGNFYDPRFDIPPPPPTPAVFPDRTLQRGFARPHGR